MLAEIVPAGLFAFFLVFARVGSALMVLPGFGETYVSPRFGLILALAMTLVVVPFLLPLLPSAPSNPVALLLLLVGEIVVGIFIGGIARVILSALQVAGMIISFQSSMANAFTFDPISAQQGALAGGFLTTVGLLLIFVSDMHHLMLAAVVDSYAVFTPGVLPPLGDFSDAFTRIVARAFVLALKVAAPFIMIGLMFSLGVGVLARLMPQVRVFIIAMPLQITVGFLVLALTVSASMLLLLGDYERLFSGVLTAE
jgi:flagellar biosynthetic protein FliR